MPEFKVGDTVWFKPEHRSYAMEHYKTMGPLTIYRVSEGHPEKIAWLLVGKKTSDSAGTYFKRLQHNVFLEAAMKAIADAGT